MLCVKTDTKRLSTACVFVRVAIAKYIPCLRMLLCVPKRDLHSFHSSLMSTRRSTVTSQSSDISGPFRRTSTGKFRLSSASDSESVSVRVILITSVSDGFLFIHQHVSLANGLFCVDLYFDVCVMSLVSKHALLVLNVLCVFNTFRVGQTLRLISPAWAPGQLAGRCHVILAEILQRSQTSNRVTHLASSLSLKATTQASLKR